MSDNFAKLLEFKKQTDEIKTTSELGALIKEELQLIIASLCVDLSKLDKVPKEEILNRLDQLGFKDEFR
jgi:hypothetical protein